MSRLLENGLKSVNPRGYQGSQGWLWWALTSGCGKKRPGYDRLATRRFEFVPLWNMAVFFVYAMRRVDCPTCGVTVERVPWGDGKGHLTTSYL